MTTFLATLAWFAIALLLMAVGVLLGRRPPQGSCGGLARLCEKTGEELCEDCPFREESTANDKQEVIA